MFLYITDAYRMFLYYLYNIYAVKDVLSTIRYMENE